MSARVTMKESKSILTTATGFLEGYTHTLNPYAGCSFGCSYCYVRQMPIGLFREETWGEWVDVKQNAAALLEKDLAKARKKGAVSIFMSSSTDPYQPAEHKAEITRGILEMLTEDQPDFLLVQTRSPLVKRDLDLLSKFGNKVRVSMTVETDLDSVRKIFAASAPPIQARLKTLKILNEAGIPVQAALSPVLPCSDQFPSRLKEVTNRVVIDDFFTGDGSGGKRTEKLKIRDIYKKYNLDKWYNPNAHKMVYRLLRKEFKEAELFISKEGFLP
ncbi:SPL family radical SAM protein [Pseudalkalibacillus caeni]|uniref:Radical SAM protein n=1 Tax=Exobacillus caeni TaxID=2574798 RepID=A0A5R9F8V4_9BACL|nr:radical SAM protein [Pseudalkalibacillus caeni]TLS36135.1 radical SAM protein [Pseudalkalibacillus caeni]